MKRDWVNECITGQQPVRPSTASRASAGVRSILGERADRPPEPDAATRPPSIPAETEATPAGAPDAPEAAAPEEPGVPVEGDVASLVTAWESGSQMTVAQRVLDGLPSYRDFVSLVYQIGQEGATQLASMMDELSASAEGDGESPVLPPSREPAGEEDAVAGADDQPPV